MRLEVVISIVFYSCFTFQTETHDYFASKINRVMLSTSMGLQILMDSGKT